MNYPSTNNPPTWSYTTTSEPVLRLYGEDRRQYLFPINKIECIHQGEGGGIVVNCAKNCYMFPNITINEIAKILGWVGNA
jgi:hypothetical protein